MAKYPTKHFTPTSTESSAFAWDRLADKVIGHVGAKTTQTNLDEAFALMTDEDVRLLASILTHLPAIGVDHLSRAADRANARRSGSRSPSL